MTGTNSTGTYMRQGTAVELASMTFLLVLLVLITVIDETDGGGRTDPLTKIRYWACFVLFCHL